jgi:hypothetical protein
MTSTDGERLRNSPDQLEAIEDANKTEMTSC